MTGLEPNDSELLRHYAEARSEEAFTAVVNRHLPLGLLGRPSPGRRKCPSSPDITQAVFTELARRAESLARHPTLAGWLQYPPRITSPAAPSGATPGAPPTNSRRKPCTNSTATPYPIGHGFARSSTMPSRICVKPIVLPFSSVFWSAETSVRLERRSE